MSSSQGTLSLVTRVRLPPKTVFGRFDVPKALGYLPRSSRLTRHPVPRVFQYFGSSVTRAKVSSAVLRSVSGGGARARADAVSTTKGKVSHINTGKK